jgi:integrase
MRLLFSLKKSLHTAILYRKILVLMTTSNNTQMADAIERQKLSPKLKTSTSKDGKWRTFTTFSGLMQYVPSGVYFARCKANGKLKRASLETDVFTTAKDKLALKLKELKRPPAEAGTFAEARLLYLADNENDHALSEQTKRYWQFRVQALLKSWPQLDGMKLDKIKPADCKAWGKRFSGQFEAVNFNNTLAAFRNILKRGGLEHDRNPAMGLKRLGAKQKQMTLPEPEQFDAIVKTVRSAGARQSKDCADLVCFLAYGGCRISEAKQVLWEDVDFERGEIRVHNAKRSKTTSAHDLRFVPIIPAMRGLLERMKAERNSSPSQRVCVLGECEKSLTNACDKVGVARITHHDLRHLFATRCIEAGVDIPTVSRWLGHVDGGALAMKVYGHLRRSHSQQAAQRVTFGEVLVPEIIETKLLPPAGQPETATVVEMVS